MTKFSNKNVVYYILYCYIIIIIIIILCNKEVLYNKTRDFATDQAVIQYKGGRDGNVIRFVPSF